MYRLDILSDDDRIYYFLIISDDIWYLSGTFFSWVFQYAGRMTIVRPEKASNWYVNMLQDALDDALAYGDEV